MTAPLPDILAAVSNFADTRVLVVGDVMIDHYVWGSVERVSPEAPVPVVKVERDSWVLGGASNVVHNITALGGQALVAGVTGADDDAARARQMLIRIGVEDRGLIQDASRRTTVKSRIIGNHQQVSRVDREDARPIDQAVFDALLAYIDEKMPLVQGVVLSDYGKGVLTEAMVAAVVERSVKHGKVCAVDPKVRHFDLYRGATIITPNHHEAGQALGRTLRTLDDVREGAVELRELVGCEHVLITFASRGMCLLDAEGTFTHIGTRARQVFDVTGAGDTVISALTLALSAGMSPRHAAHVANVAAGIVVGEFGTATATEIQLRAALETLKEDH